jgi:predicted MFS family arabinose efflux permease
MTYFHSLSAAGFAATAISFGPARMGFGLFVPQLRDEFSMSSTTIGLVSSLGFLGFFLGLTVVLYLLMRSGPVLPVLIGLTAATGGLAVVAVAPTLWTLAFGVFLAASSAGFAWTPFNDAVHRKVRDVDRPTALSEISTGTSVGIALAGLAAVVTVTTELGWRACWAFFAAVSALALAGNRFALRSIDRDENGPMRSGWRDIVQPGAQPLFAVAFVLGTVSAIYISFAADHVRTAGGVPGVPASAAPGVLFIAMGAFGLGGLLTGRLRTRLGLPWLLRLLLLTGAGSAILVPLAATTWIGLVSSAGMQGVHIMMTSAVLAFWSEELFPDIPSLSFTGALLAMAAGSVLGPMVAGLLLDMIGATGTFLTVAALPLTTALLLRDEDASAKPLRRSRKALA